MAKKYTAADFANAQFAEHKDGSVIARCNPDSTLAWENDECLLSDGEMARTGWVPVPTKTTITESQYSDLTEWAKNWRTRGHGGRGLLAAMGITIIPDPEPTNTEKWQTLVDKWQEECDNESPHISFAEWLDRKGITAPDVKDN